MFWRFDSLGAVACTQQLAEVIKDCIKKRRGKKRHWYTQTNWRQMTDKEVDTHIQWKHQKNKLILLRHQHYAQRSIFPDMTVTAEEIVVQATERSKTKYIHMERTQHLQQTLHNGKYRIRDADRAEDGTKEEMKKILGKYLTAPILSPFPKLRWI